MMIGEGHGPVAHPLDPPLLCLPYSITCYGASFSILANKRYCVAFVTTMCHQVIFMNISEVFICNLGYDFLMLLLLYYRFLSYYNELM